MRKTLVSFILLLALATTSYGVVIGNFELQMDNFGPTWETAPTFGYSTNGATLDNYSLSVLPGKTGFTWSFMYSGIQDLDANPILEVDVTWIAAEWGSTPWVNFKDVAVNSNAGWLQLSPSDPLNPDWPGSWDPSWGDHTRHLTWDFSDYDMSGVTDWMQIIFSTNFGGTTPGNYYIDNVQLTPEPTTIALLGLGGLALLRRKH
jgi:hypothetical protein